MSSTKVAPAVARYIAAANAQDIDAVAACFADHALVHDEKRDWRGPPAIRRWARDASKKYSPILEVLDVAQTGDSVIVAGRVSGRFPGSPVELRYAFILNGNKIERLEIT